MSREELVALMKSSKSEEEWCRNCQIVKSKFNGDYPIFWFSAILVSGVFDETQRSCSSSSSAEVIPNRLSFIATSHKEINDEVEHEDDIEDAADNICTIS